MTREAKRIAAVMAAIEQYLAEEAARPAVTVSPAPATSLWAMAGRIERFASRAALGSRNRR
jgi:hypothetical protein